MFLRLLLLVSLPKTFFTTSPTLDWQWKQNKNFFTVHISNNSFQLEDTILIQIRFGHFSNRFYFLLVFYLYSRVSVLGSLLLRNKLN